MNNDYKHKKIAVVGASSDPTKYGHRIYRDLLLAGYDVTGINPKGEDILGRQVYKSLKDMPSVPDIVITVVPPAVTDQITDQCIELGVQEIWMQPGSESRPAAENARQNRIRVTTSCFMTARHIW